MTGPDYTDATRDDVMELIRLSQAGDAGAAWRFLELRFPRRWGGSKPPRRRGEPRKPADGPDPEGPATGPPSAGA